jgi:hypothetical protein
LLVLRRRPFVPVTTDSRHDWCVVPNLARGLVPPVGYQHRGRCSSEPGGILWRLRERWRGRAGLAFYRGNWPLGSRAPTAVNVTVGLGRPEMAPILDGWRPGGHRPVTGRSVLGSDHAHEADLSARKAAEELNRRGITTAEGGKWFAAQVNQGAGTVGRNAMKNVHTLLSWLKTAGGLSYSEILAAGYGGVLNEALRDGLVERSASDLPEARRRSGVREDYVKLTDAGRKAIASP